MIDYTLFDSRHDVAVKSGNQRSRHWSKLVKNFSKHLEVSSKEKAALFTGAKFKAGGRRCAEDIEYYSMLVLDYDSSYEVDEFIKQYGELEFLLYTSFSHTELQHKFRVMLPLKKKLWLDDYRLLKDAFSIMFDGVDPASFTPSQCFYVPSCPPARRDLARAYHNRGEWLDLTQAIQDAALLRALKMVKRAARRSTGGDVPALVDAESVLEGVSPNLPRADWIRVGMVLKAQYGDEAFAVFDDWSSDGGSYDVTTTFKVWESLPDTVDVGFGTLVYLKDQYDREIYS